MLHTSCSTIENPLRAADQKPDTVVKGIVEGHPPSKKVPVHDEMVENAVEMIVEMPAQLFDDTIEKARFGDLSRQPAPPLRNPRNPSPPPFPTSSASVQLGGTDSPGSAAND